MNTKEIYQLKDFVRIILEELPNIDIINIREKINGGFEVEIQIKE